MVGVAVGVAVEVEVGEEMVSLVLRVCRLVFPHAVWEPKLNVLLGRHQ